MRIGAHLWRLQQVSDRAVEQGEVKHDGQVDLAHVEANALGPRKPSRQRAHVGPAHTTPKWAASRRSNVRPLNPRVAMLSKGNNSNGSSFTKTVAASLQSVAACRQLLEAGRWPGEVVLAWTTVRS
eukprot:4590740-Prymnesium_polylepis.2